MSDVSCCLSQADRLDTSRYPPSKGVHGRYGTFLASVADLSLLTVVSRSSSGSSESTLTIHDGKVLRRHTSNSREGDTSTSQSGTRVAVRDLFGCMPVRARLRPSPDSAAWSRDWDSLIRSVVALLLAWPKDVSVTIQDEVNGAKRTLKTSPDQDGASRSARLLSQAGLCETTSPESWVSIGASVSGVRVSGSVCLEPSASKKAQFLRIGVTPLSEAHQADELYGQINKIFAGSNFGTAEPINGDKKTPRGPMNKFVQGQRPRKAVDRWPMLSLGIDLDGTVSVDDILDDRRQYMAVIMGLIRTIFVEFLKARGFYDVSEVLYGSDHSNSSTPGSPTKKQKTKADTSSTQTLPRRSKDAQSLFSTWPQTKTAKSARTKTTIPDTPEQETHTENTIEEQSKFFAREDSPDGDVHPDDSCCDASTEMGDWDGNVLTSGDLKISRASLAVAKVIGQVDNKFILMRAPEAAEDDDGTGPLLILVDQHAADERCRVEVFLRNYFAPAADGDSSHREAVTTILTRPLQFELAANERSLLERSKAYFRHWGVVYDVAPKDGPESDTTLLRVTALPASITDRCRQEPRLVVDLIRKKIWDRKEADVALGAIPGSDASWTTRFNKCPRGILDLINSRACRSAIKFNDFLTHNECVHLVDKLLRCSFPFQCAHGRPSMVPLLNLEKDDSLDELDEY